MALQVLSCATAVNITLFNSTDKHDYSPSFSFNILTFSNGINETFITVTIADDDLFEGTETFIYTLTSDIPLLTFSPSMTTVNIIDNEG